MFENRREMKKKVSLFLTALSCAVGAVAASEINSVQVAEVHGNVTAHKHRTDNNEYKPLCEIF